MRQKVAEYGLRLHGGQWPPRLTLWKELEHTENQYNEARGAYRQAGDHTDEGKQARLRLLRLAGLCLYLAICVETVAEQEGVGDSAISGTLTRVTSAFLKGGFTIPEKQISRQQVINAMLAVLRSRERSPENEEEELAAIDREQEKPQRNERQGNEC